MCDPVRAPRARRYAQVRLDVRASALRFHLSPFRLQCIMGVVALAGQAAGQQQQGGSPGQGARGGPGAEEGPPWRRDAEHHARVRCAAGCACLQPAAAARLLNPLAPTLGAARACVHALMCVSRCCLRHCMQQVWMLEPDKAGEGGGGGVVSMVQAAHHQRQQHHLSQHSPLAGRWVARDVYVWRGRLVVAEDEEATQPMVMR